MAVAARILGREIPEIWLLSSSEGLEYHGRGVGGNYRAALSAYRPVRRCGPTRGPRYGNCSHEAIPLAPSCALRSQTGAADWWGELSIIYLQSWKRFSIEHELAFWRQTHGPENRNVIPAAFRIPIWDASELGLDRSLAALRRWQPDIIYCQLIPDPATEAKILEVAPSVFFAHDYHGTCISGGKATHFPVLQPCTRRFGPACLGHFYLRRCGGKDPITMVQDYRLNVQRLRLL